MATTKTITCPRCGHGIVVYNNPVPTVDIIIEYNDGIVMIYRKNPPEGWALPGGFVDYGESLEDAAIREAREETGLEIRNLRMFHVYSSPDRDPRGHTITTVFIAVAHGELIPGDDAANAKVFALDNLPQDIAFDHASIIADYTDWKKGEDKGILYK